MTYGHGAPPGGWPPSEPDPSGQGRRRAPEPDAGDDRRGYDGPGGRAPVPGQLPGGGRASVPGVYSSGGRAPVPGGPPPGRQPTGGRASVPGGPPPGRQPVGGRASVPGGYPAGERPDQRYGPGPGNQPGSVPPPPSYRPSWSPSRNDPEAEPSWPTPSRGAAPPGGWSGPQGREPHPADDEYGYPPAGRGRATPPDRAMSGRAGVAPVGRGAVPPQRSGRGGPGVPGPDGRLPNKLWMSVLGAVLAVALLAIGVVGTMFVLHGGGDSANAGPPKRDISSQQVDPTPLTTDEVFPAATVAPNPAGTPYQVVTKLESDDCTTAAVGDLATLLTGQGCTQVVRATLLSPDQAYVITTGIFNLRDKTGATAADAAIRADVGSKKGRFTGLAAGGATNVVGTAATQLGWDTEGHFLVYCMVARADGKAIDSGDDAAAKIINDMVEVTLKGTVIAARLTPRTPSSGPSGAASAGGGPSGK